jgi:hypothetical protein
MVRPMHPNPATSTSFSCQLSKTLIAADAVSLEAPGREPTWVNPPVDWGVTFDADFGWAMAMPL